MSEDFGDFEEVKNEEKKGAEQPIQQQEHSNRVRLPRNKEIIGMIVQRLGGNRMEVACSDGKTRNCRVPGRYKRHLWLRPKNIVIIVPWEFDDSRGEVIYKYPPSEVNQLRKRRLLDNISEEF